MYFSFLHCVPVYLFTFFIVKPCLLAFFIVYFVYDSYNNNNIQVDRLQPYGETISSNNSYQNSLKVKVD